MTFKNRLVSLIDQGQQAFYRFPFAAVISLSITILGLYMVEDRNADEDFLMRLFLTLLFAFFLTVASVLCAEQLKLSRRNGLLLQLAVAAPLSVGFYAVVHVSRLEADVIRAALFLGAAFLSILVTSFLMHRERINEFWAYNVNFFGRLFFTLVLSGILYAGIAIILYTVDELFEVKIDHKTYMDFWVVVASFIAPLFFLGGFPKDPTEPQQSYEYPKYLKILTHYILTPLVCVYAAILYLYGIKIIVTGVWPEGIVASLILGFSFVGVITYALLSPVIRLGENSFMRRFGGWFFAALLPLIVLLFVAIFIRINEYGVTENRYLIVVFGAWIAAISLYFIFSARRNIILIPATFTALMLLVSFGPWGAFSVSQRSQIDRLEEILMRNNILVNGKIKERTPKKFAASEDLREVSAVLEYLARSHGFSALQPWFTSDIASLVAGKSRWNVDEAVATLMGIPGYSRSKEVSRGEYVSLRASRDFRYATVIPTAGYTHVIPSYGPSISEANFVHNGFQYEVTSVVDLEGDIARLILNKNNQKLGEIDLYETAVALAAEFTGIKEKLSPEQLSIVRTIGDVQVKFVFSDIHGWRKDLAGAQVISQLGFSASVLLKLP